MSTTKPNLPKDDAAWREFFSKTLTATNALMEKVELEEPLLSKFKDIKQSYNAALEQLPLTDSVEAAQRGNWVLQSLYSALLSAQGMMTCLREQVCCHAEKVKEVMAASKSAADQVQALLDEKVKSGEYVPKATVMSLCDAATQRGIEQGEQKLRQEQEAREAAAKVVASRKDLLVKASLPLPETDTVLGGTDHEFEAVKTKAVARVEALRKKLPTGSVLLAKAWLPDAEFEAFDRLAGEMLKHGGGAPPAEPLAGAGGQGDGGRNFPPV